jgi:ADP-ribose pyrophosphatase
VRSPGAVAAVPLIFGRRGQPVGGVGAPVPPAVRRLVLEIPAGMRDVPGEPTEVTAARELVEEVGLEAGTIEHLLDFHPSAGMTDSVLYLYLATDLGRSSGRRTVPRRRTPRWSTCRSASAVDMVLRGEIRDAKTIVGLLLVERELRSSGAWGGA